MTPSAEPLARRLAEADAYVAGLPPKVQPRTFRPRP